MYCNLSRLLAIVIELRVASLKRKTFGSYSIYAKIRTETAFAARVTHNLALPPHAMIKKILQYQKGMCRKKIINVGLSKSIAKE
jgi:hypothetical protein